jgi:hypothetical protein
MLIPSMQECRNTQGIFNFRSIHMVAILFCLHEKYWNCSCFIYFFCVPFILLYRLSAPGWLLLE